MTRFSNPYDRRRIEATLSPRSAVGIVPDPEQVLHGIQPLSEQIRTYRACGIPPKSRVVGDAMYDEDDVTDVDPTTEFGLDRFERSVAVSDMVSDRLRKKYEEDLNPAT